MPRYTLVFVLNDIAPPGTQTGSRGCSPKRVDTRQAIEAGQMKPIAPGRHWNVAIRIVTILIVTILLVMILIVTNE